MTEGATEREPFVPGKIPGIQYVKVRQSQRQKKRDEFAQNLTQGQKFEKDLAYQSVNLSTTMPEILYLANKAEDGYEGDVLTDFYSTFYHARKTDDQVQPLFISAEHGDGLTDLFAKIKELIPPEKEQEFIDRKAKRTERYQEYKQMLLDEIVDLKREEMYAAAESQSEADEQQEDDFDPQKELEIFVRSWEKEFDSVNGNVEENSDFDSDNDINPLDTMDDLGRYYNSKS